MNAFDRAPGLSPTERDELKTVFLARLVRMDGLIEAPSSRDAAQSLLEERRNEDRTRLLARVLDIQAKDIPIVVLAFKHRDRSPTILTNDRDFATCSPAEHNLSEISIEHVA